MNTSVVQPLMTPFQLGSLHLPNRVVMASMTRGRATNAALVPTQLHVDYYRQRASAGLVMTEGIWVCPRAIGFINVPGLYTPEQVAGWKAVTAAVHAEGGRIFAQLAHSGAVSHPDFFDGELPFAPSAINPLLKSFTPNGFKETVVPHAMSTAEIKATVGQYRHAATNALEAGFDGVELHAATTYLLPQFLNSALNVRDDAYGGSAENRGRLVLEVIDAMVEVWGSSRVGIKIAPTVQMGGFGPTAETVSTYDRLVTSLNVRPLSHLQVVRASASLVGTPAEILQDTVSYYRRIYDGVIIANQGFNKSSANAVIENGEADLVSFGAPFIGNPDLPKRLADDLPLATSNRDTYYQGGAEGYLDYRKFGEVA